MTSIIKTESLSKDYGSKRALDSITLDIESGLPIGLVGPNGAGKTTFFSIVCGYIQASAGSIEVFGTRPADPALRGRISILPQDARLAKGVAVLQQLRTFAELQGFSYKSSRTEAQRVLELVELADVGKQPPEFLSHGMYKRVAIAQAFIGEPELVILDEPTSGLDPNTAESIRALIHTQKTERTFIISSHNLDDIENLCQRILIMKQGKITHYEEVAQLINRTNILSIRLEQAAPGNIKEMLTIIDSINHIEISDSGDHRITIHFSEENAAGIEISVLQCLTQAGIQYREFSRGESLSQKVSDITKD